MYHSILVNDNFKNLFFVFVFSPFVLVIKRAYQKDLETELKAQCHHDANLKNFVDKFKLT